MINRIPRLIHQVWSDKVIPIPEVFENFADTWKTNNSEWEYKLWGQADMDNFIALFYPELLPKYESFPYDIQRWDAIRYLILDKLGGVYVDIDSECLKPIDELIGEHECCFSLEPKEHCMSLSKDIYFNNAFIGVIPKHPFIQKVINRVFSSCETQEELFLKYDNMDQKLFDVLTTTGPLMLTDVYTHYENKSEIYLIPPKYASPFSKSDTQDLLENRNLEQLNEKLQDAYLVHYFTSIWRKDE